MTNEDDIRKLEEKRFQGNQIGLLSISKLRNLGLLYARNKNESLTMYIIDEFKTHREFAENKNVMVFVHAIDKAIDDIEEVMNKW